MEDDEAVIGVIAVLYGFRDLVPVLPADIGRIEERIKLHEIPGRHFFGGQVPDSIEDLMKLPGVGRKTANVVASICYNSPVIAVDTHVFRVAHRMGLSQGKTPFDVEQDLEAQIPEEDRARAHHWLILHGRYVCKATKPDCEGCGVAHLCPKILEGSKLSRK